MPDPPTESMEEVIRNDGRYAPEAYEFLHAGLARAAEATHGKGATKPGQRHVTGKQMCLALRDLAIERWGMLAKAVLARWNINATIDFGNMVYLLIRHDFMHKTEEDSIEDFRDVYDFDDAFGDAAFSDHFELNE
ncbi:MAG: hypothetical protein J7M14_03770 [Planctomycetes bacterium]|nr:hypothetical protein [Planctomycetota bacterium]